MAVIYRASLVPSKIELMRAWLAGRPWATEGGDVGDVGDVEQLAAYRFDDPASEVGMEGFLLRAGDRVLHVPLSYRGAPLAGAEAHLVGTTEHSVLGTRWVYDGCGDPVWVVAAASVALGGAAQAEELIEHEGWTEARRPSATVRGTGTGRHAVEDVTVLGCDDDGPTTTVRTDRLDLAVARVLRAEAEGAGVAGEGADASLVGTWTDGDAEAGPATLATLRLR